MGYALHNGVPASVSSFEAASTDLLFMYERVRTTPAPPHRGTVHTHTDTRPPDDVNGASSWAMSSSRRYHRERERERERGGGSRQAWSCSLRVLVGFHELDDDREMRREQAHSPGTDNGVRRTVKAIFRQSFLLVPRIRYQRTTVTPCPHTFSIRVQSFPQKFSRFVSTFYYYPSVNVRIVCENLN